MEELIPCIKNSEYAESALENLLTRENSRALGRQAGNVEVLTVWSDPIADMLTRIRNANLVFKDQLDVPASNLKKSIADILAREGFIKGYTYIEDGKQGILRIQMKYKGSRRNKERVIHGIVRVSKSPASCLSGRQVAGSPITRLTIRPRCAAGRAAICLVQR